MRFWLRRPSIGAIEALREKVETLRKRLAWHTDGGAVGVLHARQARAFRKAKIVSAEAAANSIQKGE